MAELPSVDQVKWFAAILADYLNGNEDPMAGVVASGDAKLYVESVQPFIRNVADRINLLSPRAGERSNTALLGLVESGALIEDDSTSPVKYRKRSS